MIDSSELSAGVDDDANAAGHRVAGNAGDIFDNLRRNNALYNRHTILSASRVDLFVTHGVELFR
jgi:hypothetical protein